ncbi:hypothetical protein BDN72DRAFT_596381 [Pluteus cervinus]|uniref:Uncharacterized protein n=1 Tax=Pluteus cervinus TaxID=181527 RepID=A0ACD3AWM1_9AGAR|nr:hypothetical protein BDN72DRAFT_596381 [Pluteus cervinus]
MLDMCVSGSQFFNTQNIQNIGCSAVHDDDPLKILRDKCAFTASFDSAGRCDALQCHPETRKVIKESLIFWVDSAAAESNLKWVYGSVGVGKSALSKWIAEYYTKKGQLAASFLFFRGHQDTCGLHKFIPTITYLTAISDTVPLARARIIERIKNDPTIFMKSFESQWERLVIEPLTSAQRPVLIVIDGIDEITSADEQTSLLRCILNSLRRVGPFIKVLLVSRLESQIREEFDTFGLSKASRISLGASHADRSDLRVFLTLSLGQVHQRRHKNGTMTRVSAPWPPPHIIDKLVNMADLQLIYATILIAFIDDKN